MQCKYQCYGSVKFLYGSVPGGPYLVDPDSDLEADPDPISFVSDLQDVKKKNYTFFCSLLFKGTFTAFPKEVTKQ